MTVAEPTAVSPTGVLPEPGFDGAGAGAEPPTEIYTGEAIAEVCKGLGVVEARRLQHADAGGAHGQVTA